VTRTEAHSPPTRPSWTRRAWRKAAPLTLLAAGIGATFGSAPAHAAAGDYSRVLDQTNVRVCGSLALVWCGSSYNGVMGSVAGEQWDRTWCWRDGGWALGTNRWFKVTAWTDNGWKTGWVSAALVPDQASVPWCSSWQ
jgi:hypothetical protein